MHGCVPPRSALQVALPCLLLAGTASSCHSSPGSCVGTQQHGDGKAAWSGHFTAPAWVPQALGTLRSKKRDSADLSSPLWHVKSRMLSPCSDPSPACSYLADGRREVWKLTCSHTLLSQQGNVQLCHCSLPSLHWFSAHCPPSHAVFGSWGEEITFSKVPAVLHCMSESVSALAVANKGDDLKDFSMWRDARSHCTAWN